MDPHNQNYIMRHILNAAESLTYSNLEDAHESLMYAIAGINVWREEEEE